jgi:hypothetical protein
MKREVFLYMHVLHFKTLNFMFFFCRRNLSAVINILAIINLFVQDFSIL